MSRISGLIYQDQQEMKTAKAIPIPKRTSSKLGQCKYPFTILEVDESFAIDEDKRYSVSTLAKRYGDKNKKEFTVCKDDKGQMRCWRVV